MIEKELVKLELEKLVENLKNNLITVKKLAVDEAWKILQLATVDIIQNIEHNAINLPGKDKKQLALEFLSKFYDTSFTIIDIPLVPNIFEPIIHRYLKSFLMLLIGSTIDAMVTTFKQIGVFHNSTNTVQALAQNQKAKIKSTKRKGKRK